MLRVLLIILVIPLIGYGISTWIIADLGAQNAQVLCAGELVQTDPDLRAACSDIAPILLLQSASVYAALLGIGIPVLFWLASLFAGSNRSRLALVFPSLIRIVLLLMAILVVMQGAILTYGAYIGESYAIGRVHFFLIGAVGLGAAIAAIGLLSTLFSFGKNLQMPVTGTHITKDAAPNLWRFVEELADKLGSLTPKNIVVGLDPNFFVTNADIYVVNDEKLLTGETLFVSAPLSGLMKKEELAAVIGHELGHFRGEDTVYSMKFAPVYAGMAGALSAVAVGEDEGTAALAKLPAFAVLSYMYDVFSRNERLVGRDREILADKAGAEASSPKSLATALAKVSFYAGLWPQAQRQNINRLSEGKITSNLATVFFDSAKYDIEHDKFEEILGQILDIKIAHPTDSHPSFSERLESLQIDPRELTKDDVLPPEEGSAIDLIDNSTAMEERLTQFEHNLMVALGHVVVPEGVEEQNQQFLNALYSMAAAMVGADGRIDPQEIAVAEGIGQKMVDGFDSVDFRAACTASDLPSFADLLDILKHVVDEETKSKLRVYLTEIAEADGEVSREEQQLLDQLTDKFEL